MPMSHSLHVWKTVHNAEQFFVRDLPVALYSSEGFCIVLNWMQLLAFVNHIVFRQCTSNCLMASISLYDCLESSIELGEDESREESCSGFVEGLLL